MKELDVVLSHYLEQHYSTASATEQGCFRQLLEMDDPDLYRLMLGQDRVEDEALQQFAEAIRQKTNRR